MIEDKKLYTCLSLIYIIIMVFPLLWRFYLPSFMGETIFLLFIVLIPILFTVINLSINLNKKKTIYFFMLLFLIIIYNLMFCGNNNYIYVIYGIKNYLLPFSLVFIGLKIGLFVKKRVLSKIILLFLIIHLVFSLFFLLDILTIPLLIENYYKTITIDGSYLAAFGLTCSKFELAYQLIPILLIIFVIKNKYTKYIYLIANILIILTLNKTAYIVSMLIFFIFIFGEMAKNKKARIYFILLIPIIFFTMKYSLDHFSFLSFQTLSSRFIGWNNLIDITQIMWFSPNGFGFTDINNITFDNQFLTIYYEVGLIVTLLTLILFYKVFNSIIKDKNKILNIGLFCISLAGLVTDVFNNYSMFFVFGLVLTFKENVRNYEKIICRWTFT